MKPLIYGYLRRLPGTGDADEARLIGGLSALAEAEGFALGPLPVEVKPRGVAAFRGLIDRCLRDDVQSVVVPSPDHLNTLPLLACLVAELLKDEISGQVWIVTAGSEEPSCPPTMPRGVR
ncbi:hypothetical protein [Streptomyces sp. NPDC049906]|uniref:hypothetical protein n=1 Tax=Streptomyces sp. NPDC049906 TaxID=3155656 RepID=UPI00342A8A61